MSTARTLRTLTLTVLAAVTLTACQDPTGTNAPGPPAGSGPVAQLAALPIHAEDTGAHYRRDDWGDWASHGAGCDTREQVLRDQGRNVHLGAGCKPTCPASTAPCWISPYDGTGLRNPNEVQIDHRVPIKEAVRSGARTWNRAQRERFYNDPTNLVAVSATSNTSKGDKDPGRWRPSNRDTWCAYATGYIATKTTYHLSVDQREHDALAAMLRTCH
jgi:hypothetical protein